MSCPYNCITLPQSLLFRKIPYLLVKMPVGRDSVVEQFSKGINICIVSYILDIMDRDEYNHKQSLICDCLWYNFVFMFLNSFFSPRGFRPNRVFWSYAASVCLCVCVSVCLCVCVSVCLSQILSPGKIWEAL